MLQFLAAAWPLHGRDDGCCCRVGGGGLCAAAGCFCHNDCDGANAHDDELYHGRHTSSKNGGKSVTNRRPASVSIVIALEFGSREGEPFWLQQ